MTALAPRPIPPAGTTRALALASGHQGAQASLEAMILDSRRQTLQQQAAPIAHLDLAYPFPSQLKPVTMTPGIGDPGAYSSAASLEDR